MPDGFEHGHLQYSASQVPAIDTAQLQKEWDGGFLTFSAGEQRISKGAASEQLLERVKKINEKVSADLGYLNDINLWKSDGSITEELVIEREDNGFYVQHWTLNRDPKTEQLNCCYRDVEVFPRSKLTEDKKRVPVGIFGFNELGATEVIWYDMRLHFFLTTVFKNEKG